MIPDFSVVIATYNRADVLSRAVLSLINQTCASWEGIVVDDGSTDNTRQVISDFISKGYSIQYIQQNHFGEVGAKNKGISKSSGRYITFLDSDDEYKTNHLESRLRILQQDSSIQLLHGGVTIIGNKYVPDIHQPGRMISLSECVIGGTFFLRADAMLSLDGLRQKDIGSDADLFSRAVEKEFIIKRTDIPTYIYHREREDSITHKYVPKNDSGGNKK